MVLCEAGEDLCSLLNDTEEYRNLVGSELKMRNNTGKAPAPQIRTKYDPRCLKSMMPELMM